jgi:MraZ protein
VFRGVSAINVDAKGRMAMPAKYRDRLQECCNNRLVLTVDLDRCLLLFPEPDWEQFERKLMQLPTLNTRTRRLQRLFLGHASECEIDNQGRILLPQLLREYAGLDKHVVLVGQGAKFELWDEKSWNDNRETWLAEEAGNTEALPVELETLSF